MTNIGVHVDDIKIAGKEVVTKKAKKVYIQVVRNPECMWVLNLSQRRGISRLWDWLTFTPVSDSGFETFLCVVANLSSHNINLYRNGKLTVVESGKIDWYPIGNVGSDVDIKLNNSDGSRIRYLTIYGNDYARLSISEASTLGDEFFFEYKRTGGATYFALVAFIFDYNGQKN